MKPLHIGLVNNMAGAALEATERHFFRLLNAAAPDATVTFSLYALPGIARASERYSGIESLWDTGADALIVTGREPRAKTLRDEPYWRSFVRLVEWAERNTISTVWSCLAAHAVALHLDGIERSPSRKKLFGIYDCERVSEYGLAAGIPDRFRVPHSRWNGLHAEQLAASGYRLLSRSPEAGVDAFTKQRRHSLFLCLQGHPEYDPDTLWFEYRRDVRRFLRYEADTFPSIPKGYFDETARLALAAFEARAVSDRREELLAFLPALQPAAGIGNTWRPAAVRLYRSWLEHVSERKSARVKGRPVNLTRAYAQATEASL